MVDACQREGAQMGALRGTEMAVLVPIEQSNRLQAASGAQLMHRQSGALYEDAMIAAMGKVHQLTVLTRNVADFSRFEVPLLNPFAS